MVRALPNASWVVITYALLDCGGEPALVWMTAPLCIAGWQQTSHNPIPDRLTNRAKLGSVPKRSRAYGPVRSFEMPWSCRCAVVPWRADLPAVLSCPPVTPTALDLHLQFLGQALQ